MNSIAHADNREYQTFNGLIRQLEKLSNENRLVCTFGAQYPMTLRLQTPEADNMRLDLGGEDEKMDIVLVRYPEGVVIETDDSVNILGEVLAKIIKQFKAAAEMYAMAYFRYQWELQTSIENHEREDDGVI
jgi:hypothetical protein